MLLHQSTDLLREYADLATLKIDTTARDRLLSTLGREEIDIGNAIKAGRRVARAEIDALLGFVGDGSAEDGGGQQGSSVLRLGAQEAQAKARAKGEGMDAKEVESWGVVAEETVKAFGKMSRVLASGEMVE